MRKFMCRCVCVNVCVGVCVFYEFVCVCVCVCVHSWVLRCVGLRNEGYALGSMNIFVHAALLWFSGWTPHARICI